MESEEDLAARLTERLPIEEAEECLCRLEEHCITVGVLGEADAQDLADELGFTERQCDAVLLDDEAWHATATGPYCRFSATQTHEDDVHTDLTAYHRPSHAERYPA